MASLEAQQRLEAHNGVDVSSICQAPLDKSRTGALVSVQCVGRIGHGESMYAAGYGAAVLLLKAHNGLLSGTPMLLATRDMKHAKASPVSRAHSATHECTAVRLHCKHDCS